MASWRSDHDRTDQPWTFRDWAVLLVLVGVNLVLLATGFHV